MKNSARITAIFSLLFVVLSLVSACSDNGPDKKATPQPTAVQTPVAATALNNPLMLVLINSQTGRPLTGEVLIDISGADASSIENPKALVSPNKPDRFITTTGLLALNVNASPSIATPVNIDISIQTSGYPDTNLSLSIDQPGFQKYAVKLMPLVFSSLSSVANTFAVQLGNVDPSSKLIDEPDNVVLETETDVEDPVLKESKFSVTVLDGTQVTDNTGALVASDISLTASFLPVDADNVAAMRLTPLSLVPDNESILSLGVVFLSFASGSSVPLQSFDTDVVISFDVPASLLNPITGNPLAVNDTLKFFPQDNATTTWTDPMAATALDATVSAVGADYATVDVTLPANTSFETPLGWNLGWAKSQVTQCASNLVFDVVDSTGQPVAQRLNLKVVAGNGVYVKFYDQALNPWYSSSTSQADLAAVVDLPGELLVYDNNGELLASQVTLADTSVISAVDGKLPLANSLCDLQGATVQINEANTDRVLIDSDVSIDLLCDVAIPVDINGDPIAPVPTPSFVMLQQDGAVLQLGYNNGAMTQSFGQLEEAVTYQFGAIEYDSGQELSIFSTPQAQFSTPLPVSCPAL